MGIKTVNGSKWSRFLFTRFRSVAAVGLGLAVVVPIASLAQQEAKEAANSSSKSGFKVETLLDRSDVIWGFDFLPNGHILFTERDGTLLIFNPKDASVTTVNGTPAVSARGQGGLLDVRVHPNFSSNKPIYMTYAKAIGKGQITTALARAKLEGGKLQELNDVFVAKTESRGGNHFGSRIEFDGKGHIFIQVGDRMERDQVQDLSFHTGKTIRLKEDGSVPQDNPFVNQKDALPEIWSLGHRSPQGLARHPSTGELWGAEMGPKGGDVVNVIQKGLNYGWPLFTYGREYSGGRIGSPTPPANVELPITYWVPSISPSGMAFYDGSAFPEWRGNIFLANLSGQHLRRLVLDGKKVQSQEVLVKDLGYRFRNVRQGPDGFLYFSTDDGKIGRLYR